jgi:hypothetical protein
LNKRYFSQDVFRRPAPLRAAVAGVAVVEEAEIAAHARESMHDPLLEPRDEAVFLLTAAAEVEHALMVQYLFAAYSVRVHEDSPAKLRQIQELLIQIAREEMGHLATVQNLLLLIGGPLNFGREHSPYASEIYPFRFKLEPVSLDSLAKYVVAESPLEPPADLTPEDTALLAQIVQDAKRANDGREVGHVGPIFARLKVLFESELKDADFRVDTFGFQAKFDDWGFEPRNPATGEKLIIESFEGADVAQLRAAALAAVRKVGEQGEGFDAPPASSMESESHFERFFAIYKLFKELSESSAVPVTWPVAESPNTTPTPPKAPSMMRMVEAVEEAQAAKGRITHPRARRWAQLFNLRYRMLLAFLSHFLRVDQPLYESTAGDKLGDRTARGFLLIWTFNEMRRLKKIAGKLVQLPKDEPAGELHAGPPFELPYTLNLPDRETERWRAHLDASRAAVRLVREQLEPGDPLDAGDEFLQDLVQADEQHQAVMQSLAAGQQVPPERMPTHFQKIVQILEEAVRGFKIGAHGNFWSGRARTPFISEGVTLVGIPIKQNADGTFDADGSLLVSKIEASPRERMPRARPPIPAERRQFIRHWIQQGCPDNEPAGKTFHGERDPAAEPLPPAPPPTDGEPLSFATDIRGLFRDFDREAMLMFADFDLHRYEDVRDHADLILARIEDGSMPCDGSWPRERIETFSAWIVGGRQP